MLAASIFDDIKKVTNSQDDKINSFTLEVNGLDVEEIADEAVDVTGVIGIVRVVLQGIGGGVVDEERSTQGDTLALPLLADLYIRVKDLPQIAAPTLFINAGKDQEIFPQTDAKPMFAAVAAKDKTFVEFAGAQHYFNPPFGQKEAPDVEKVMDVVVPWILERFGT